eukprot:TRINITY_DN1326_c0_g1_i1.p1 TRINITY_DN1326_c0_g1~~TRINITY_DN1326_c0_g1_i1.p1  ORF type:complete len:332 (-),score=41.52 TRINITY_DN1326_c0_g1_i1:302-1297(-)
MTICISFLFNYPQLNVLRIAISHFRGGGGPSQNLNRALVVGIIVIRPIASLGIESIMSEHQTGILAIGEGAAMEAFLNDKKVPGKDLLEKVDNYCKIYGVPAEIQTRMHNIRKNRNIAAHGLRAQMVELDYVSQEMKEYQSYYYRSKGKPGKTKAYNVDLAHGKAERARKPKPKASNGDEKPKRQDKPTPKPHHSEKGPRDDSTAGKQNRAAPTAASTVPRSTPPPRKKDLVPSKPSSDAAAPKKPRPPNAAFSSPPAAPRQQQMSSQLIGLVYSLPTPTNPPAQPRRDKPKPSALSSSSSSAPRKGPSPSSGQAKRPDGNKQTDRAKKGK